MNNLILNTAYGTLEFLDKNRLSDIIRTVNINNSTNIRIANHTTEYTLDRYISISGLDYKRGNSQGFTPLMNQDLLQQFTTYVMKRKEEFYIKNLSLDKIYNLNDRLNRNFPIDDCKAFIFNLNKYQNYFIILNENAFNYYCSEPELQYDRDSYICKTKLIEMNPNLWILGRCDEYGFYKESYENRLIVTNPTNHVTIKNLKY